MLALLGLVVAYQEKADSSQDAAIIRLQMEQNDITSDIARLNSEAESHRRSVTYLIKEIVDHLKTHGEKPSAKGPK